MGVIVRVAVAVLPIVLMLWAADSSGSLNIFGSELPTVVLVLPFVGTLVWAVASAVTAAGRCPWKTTIGVTSIAIDL